MTGFLFAVAVGWGLCSFFYWLRSDTDAEIEARHRPRVAVTREALATPPGVPYDWREDFAEIAALPETSEAAR